MNIERIFKWDNLLYIIFHSKNDKLFHFSKFMMYQRKERIILLSMNYSYTLAHIGFIPSFCKPYRFYGKHVGLCILWLTYIFPKKVNIKIPETVPLIELLYRLTKSHICLDKVSESAGCWSCFGRCTLRTFPKEVIIRLKILKQFTTPIYNNTYIFQIGEQVTVFFCNYEPWTQ